MRKCCSCFITEDDFSSGARRQLAMTAHEVRMQMSLDDVLDLEILSFRFFNVLIDVALRIDDSGFAFRSDQIRSVSETAEIELLEEHWAFPWIHSFRRSGRSRAPCITRSIVSRFSVVL